MDKAQAKAKVAVKDAIEGCSGAQYQLLDEGIAHILPVPILYTPEQESKILTALKALNPKGSESFHEDILEVIRTYALEYKFLRTVERDIKTWNQLKNTIRNFNILLDEFNSLIMQLGEASGSGVFEGRMGLVEIHPSDVAKELHNYSSPFTLPVAIGAIQCRLCALKSLMAFVASYKPPKNHIRKLAQELLMVNLIGLIERKLKISVHAGDSRKDDYEERPFYRLVGAIYYPIETHPAHIHSIIKSSLVKYKKRKK